MPTDPYRLSMSVIGADGRVDRWGPDEPDGRDIPQDLEFTTNLPGGFKDCTTSLLREFTRSNPDNNLLDRVIVQGPGARPAFDGFFTAFPKALGAQFTVEPAAVGWAALLNFQTGFQRIYVDRDASAWGEAPLWRRAEIADSGNPQGGIPVSTVLGGIAWDPTQGQALAINDQTQVWYAAPQGLRIAKLIYKGKRTGTWTNFEAATLFATDSNAAASSFDSQALTLDDTLRTATLATVRRQLMLRAYASAGVTPGAGVQQRYTRLAAYDDHGLTLRSFGDGDTPDGIYNSDIVADIVQRTGQGILRYTTGPGGSIEPNTVIVPHLTFKAPTTGADAIAKASGFGINALELPEWGVYDDRLFFWRTPDPDRLCWKARRSDGIKIRLEGDQLDDLYNGVLVQYTDPAGISRVVGPPDAYWYGGRALADATDVGLVDTSQTNPVNAHGISQKWAILALSQPATQAGAIALGRVFLAVQSQPQRRGQIEAQGLVQHPTKPQRCPVYDIRAGDYIQIPDSAEPDIQRRVVGTRYSHATRTNVLDIGVTPFTLDGLLEVLQATLVGTVGG